MSDYNAESIQILDGVSHVRLRPGMYIGSTGTKGLSHLIYELLDNAVDEHLQGYCNTIWITLNEDGSCTVEDNGRGIPVEIHNKAKISAARVVLTTLNAGGKFDNKSYKTSSGLHGVGSSVVNALSEWMDVEISRDGYIHHDRYERGIPVIDLKDGLLPVLQQTANTGTKISFYPDEEIFDKIVFKADNIKTRLHETAYLNPNLTIHYADRRNGSDESIIFHEPQGIIKFVAEINKECQVLHDPIQFEGTYDGENGPIVIDCVFQYVNAFQEQIYGFCNNISNPEGGTHITGFKTALTTLLNQYARQIGILKEKDDNFLGTDIRTGLTAVITVKHPDPRFEGQTKTKLDNQDAARAVSTIASEKLTWYFDRNLDDLKQILSMAEKSVKIRKAENKSKENLLSSNKKRFSFDSNGKLSNCESRNPEECEIFIVEGDSAGGSAKTGRNRKFQAILPIRGKILNVEKANMSRILANDEIKSMINAFGCGFSEGFGNDFDISKLRYHKIIIMTDADIDGAHISTLLLTLFYRFFPELIYNGHVYVATPPLYRAIPKKGKPEYLLDDKELEEYRKSHRSGSFILNRSKGLGEMDASQLWETTMNPETRTLKKVNIEQAEQASKITSILMGTDVEPRKKYIVKHSGGAILDV